MSFFCSLNLVIFGLKHTGYLVNATPLTVLARSLFLSRSEDVPIQTDSSNIYTLAKLIVDSSFKGLSL